MDCYFDAEFDLNNPQVIYLRYTFEPRLQNGKLSAMKQEKNISSISTAQNPVNFVSQN